MHLPEKVQSAIQTLAQYDIPTSTVAPFWYRQYLRFKPDTPPPLWGATNRYWSFLAFAKTLLGSLAVMFFFVMGMWESIISPELRKPDPNYFAIMFLASLCQLLIWTALGALATAVSNAKWRQAVREGQALGLPDWSVFSSEWRPNFEDLRQRTLPQHFWLKSLWGDALVKSSTIVGVMTFAGFAILFPMKAGSFGDAASFIYLIVTFVGFSRTYKGEALPTSTLFGQQAVVWRCSNGFWSGVTEAAIFWDVVISSAMKLPPGESTIFLALSALTFHVSEWFSFDQQRNLALRAEQAEQSRLLAEVRLQMLKNQIEPHFIFNTLAHLKALIRIDPVVAERMADELSDFLRASLNALREDKMTVAQDFELVRAYLALASLRMGERLTVDLQMEPATAHLAVPPLMLQTLVENAIQHGIEPKTGPGLIRVSAHLDASPVTPHLVLKVEDDGVGFGHAKTGGSGLGLVNIRERLSTAFGNRAELSLSANAPQGVVATITLPITRPT